MSSQQFPRAPLPPSGVGQGPAPAGNSTLIPGGQPGRCSSPVHCRNSFKCFDLLQLNGLVHISYTLSILSCTLTPMLRLPSCIVVWVSCRYSVEKIKTFPEHVNWCGINTCS